MRRKRTQDPAAVVKERPGQNRRVTRDSRVAGSPPAGAASPESERLFHRLIDHAPEAVVLLDIATGMFTQANPAAERLFKLSAGELCQVGPAEMSPPMQPDGRPSSEKAREFIARALAGETPVFEWTHCDAEGCEILCEVRLLRLELGGREVVHGSVTDISARKRGEEALRASEARFRALVEHSNDGIALFGADGAVLYASPSTTNVLGYLPEEVHRRNVLEFVRPDCRDAVRERLAESLRRPGVGISSGAYVQHKDGQWRFLEGIFTNLLHEPSVGAIVNNYRDITDRKQAEEALRESESFRRTIFDSEPECVKVVGRDFTLLDMNPAGLMMIGASSREQVVGQSVLTLIAPEWRSSFTEIHERVLQGNSVVAEFEICGLDGVRRRMETHAVPLRNNESLVVGQLAITRDISERRRSEEALRESEERYRELFENAKDAIYVHDLSGRYTSVNRAAEKLSGFSREQILGKHFSNFVSPRDLKHVRTNFCRKLDEENETIYEVNMVSRDGRRIPVEVSSRLVYEKGVAVGVQGSARDITDRKRAQEAQRLYSRRLIQAQETERAKIARELHDEIGQVLTAVRINLQSIKNSCSIDGSVPPLDDSIGVVDEALGRVRELSIELRPSLLDDLGLHAALRWYVDRYAQRTGIIAEVLNGFEGDSRLPRELETACFRIAQEALTNVARHARAASVSVQLQRSRERILLTIVDDGVGFIIDQLRRSETPASALGLRGMEERALAVGGYLEIDSGVQRGTRIRATFPLERH